MMEHAEHSPAAIREKAAGAVNCQSVTLPSGLTVLCRTMPGYSSVHAMYATNFGSVVREFTLNGKRIQLPAGTAHFLEHKMFESEQGDAFDLYAKTGAAANAFTSYDRTCYIFTATGMTDENPRIHRFKCGLDRGFLFVISARRGLKSATEMRQLQRGFVRIPEHLPEDLIKNE